MMILFAISLALGVVASFVLRVYAFALAVFLVLLSLAAARLVFGFHGLSSVWDGVVLLFASNGGYALGVLLQVAARFFFTSASASMNRGREASALPRATPMRSAP
jgi:hypothetical protein